MHVLWHDAHVEGIGPAFQLLGAEGFMQEVPEQDLLAVSTGRIHGRHTFCPGVYNIPTAHTALRRDDSHIHVHELSHGRHRRL